MRNFSNKLTVGFLLFFLVLLATLVSIYWLIFRGTSVGFLSFHPRLSWRTEDNKISSVKQEYATSTRGKLIVIYLSTYVKISKKAVGVGENSTPVYFLEWARFQGIDILRVSVTDGWFSADQIFRDRAIALAINKSIKERYGLSTETTSNLNILLAGDDPTAFGLKERF